MSRLLQMLINWPRPLCFARYRPAPRVGTRRVELRLLRGLHSHLASTEATRS